MTKHGIHNFGTDRLKQIELLNEWTNKNTNFHEISAYDEVKFFYSNN